MYIGIVPTAAAKIFANVRPPSASLRAGSLSVLNTCITKQTKDMVYSAAQWLGYSVFGHTRRCCMPWKESRILDQRLQFLSNYWLGSNN